MAIPGGALYGSTGAIYGLLMYGIAPTSGISVLDLTCPEATVELFDNPMANHRITMPIALITLIHKPGLNYEETNPEVDLMLGGPDETGASAEVCNT